MPKLKDILNNLSIQRLTNIKQSIEGSITRSKIRAQERKVRRKVIKELYGEKKKNTFNNKNYINPDNISSDLKTLSNFLNARTKDIVQKVKNNTVKISEKANLSFQEARKSFKEKGWDVLRPNVLVTQATKHTKQLLEGSSAGRKMLEISQHKWFRKSMVGVGIAAGLMMAEKAINSFTVQPAIPKKDERGYDVMTESLTDFGSPAKLLKTASKIITPCYSTVRKGVVTTTATVTDQNMALFLNKKAIGHTRY